MKDFSRSTVCCGCSSTVHRPAGLHVWLHVACRKPLRPGNNAVPQMQVPVMVYTADALSGRKRMVGPSSAETRLSVKVQFSNTLQESLRAAVLAEAEEDEKRVLRRMEKKDIAQGANVLTDVELSAEGRLYSEVIWRVSPAEDDVNLQRSNFVQGCTVVLCPQSSGGSVVMSALIEATVVEKASTFLRIGMDERESNRLGKLTSTPGSRMQVALGFRSTATERQLRAIEKLKDRMENCRPGARNVRAILLGSPRAKDVAKRVPDWMNSKPLLEQVKTSLLELKDLNTSQKKAIGSAIARTLTLWQGPPGTGKSRTLLGLTYVLCKVARARQYNKQKIGKVLAVAETNAAADNLLDGMRFIQCKVVRVGPISKVRPELRHLTLEALAENSKMGRKSSMLRDEAIAMRLSAQELRRTGELGGLKEAQDLEYQSQLMWKSAEAEMEGAMQTILRESEVIVSTCVSAGDKRIEATEFRVVLMDEATQATEPSSLIALTKGAECVVMAGDHLQLPPTVISDRAKRCVYYYRC